MSDLGSQKRFRPSVSFPADPLSTLAYAIPNPNPRTSLLRTDIVPIWVVLAGAFVFGIVVLAMPRYGCGCRGNSQARLAAAKTDIATFEAALSAFRADMGRYPSTEEGLQALAAPPDAGRNSRHQQRPYIKLVSNDPWGTPYVYQFPGKHNPASFDPYSRGPDQRDGHDDITNWSSP